MPTMQDALGQIDRWIADGAVRGAAAAVWHDGEVVATHQAGEAAPGDPVTHGTIFGLASVSKPFSAAAILKVTTDHDIPLDMPLADLVPDFASVDDPFDPDVLPQLEALRDLGLLQLFFGSAPEKLAPTQVEAHRAKLAEYEALRERDTGAGPRGPWLALEAGIRAERSWVEYWEWVLSEA